MIPRIKTPLAAAAACLLAIAPLAAQTPAAAAPAAPAADQTAPVPAAPPLVLPDMDSEVRGVKPDDVQAPLPPTAALPMPADLPPLPEGLELAIPESAYRTEATLDTAARPELGETFTTASVGAGLWGGVSAALSIYRPGDDPSLAMTFAHDSEDGFAFREAGTGFHAGTTALSGRIRHVAADRAVWTASAAFADTATGLQGRSQDFSGVAHRYFDLEGGYRRPIGPLELNADLTGGLVDRTLERIAAAPAGVLGVREASLAASASLAWRPAKFDLGFALGYGLAGAFGLGAGENPEPGFSQGLRADLRGAWDYSDALSLGAAFGYAYSSTIPLLFPFELSADAGLGQYFTLSAKAGLATERPTLAAAWKANPYLDAGAAPADDARWFASTRLDAFPLAGLTARLDLDWALSVPGAGRLEAAGNPTAAELRRGLFAYASRAYHSLASGLSLRWRPGSAGSRAGGAVIGLAWTADWLDAPVSGSPQNLAVDLEYREPDEAYGGTLSAKFGFAAAGFDLPYINLDAFVRLSREIRLVGEFRDIAAAFKQSEGRVRFESYLAGGFQASAKLQISL
jgi:hypothetical protein